PGTARDTRTTRINHDTSRELEKQPRKSKPSISNRVRTMNTATSISLGLGLLLIILGITITLLGLSNTKNKQLRRILSTTLYHNTLCENIDIIQFGTLITIGGATITTTILNNQTTLGIVGIYISLTFLIEELCKNYNKTT
ncbi:MAG: hypothetical protein LRS46_00005, partial [Desulfurococcales archaeon]|nr:hypothetical protein [Desulfurococcales archaeon]